MTTYIGEWLTIDQAARALRVARGELRKLFLSGDIECVEIRPKVWRVKTSTVDDLLATPNWKTRVVGRVDFSNAEQTGPTVPPAGPPPAAEFSADPHARGDDHR